MFHVGTEEPGEHDSTVEHLHLQHFVHHNLDCLKNVCSLIFESIHCQKRIAKGKTKKDFKNLETYFKISLKYILIIL